MSILHTKWKPILVIDNCWKSHVLYDDIVDKLLESKADKTVI